MNETNGNSSAGGDTKKLKTGHSTDININDKYRSHLDGLTAWYSSGDRPADCDDLSVRLIGTPFKLICFDDFIPNQDFLNEVKKELKQLDLDVKNNDLYRFRQSTDLSNVKTGPIARIRQLFGQQIRQFVERLTDISLNEKVSLTVSRYEQNDYLLCHDDDIEDEGRRIAFILYLVPDWNKNDGGLLDMFASNDSGEPSKIVESVVPKWNSFAFFEVNPVSWHQVSEVLSDSKTRYSIHGWFNGSPRVRPVRHLEAPHSTDPATDIPLDVVKSWINPLYLNDSTQVEIQTRFEDLSEIVLQDFFNNDKYQELCQALTASEAINWRWTGPPNMRRHELANPSSCPAIILEAFELFKSEAMFLILSNMTGLKLHELAIDDGSGDESNDSIEGNPRCRGEIRRWSQSCYTLIHDNSAEVKSEGSALDVVINFNCEPDFDYRENGGFTTYIVKGEDDELLTIDPNNNCLNIVFRDKTTARFVKYINNKCVDSFHDFSFVYYE